MVEYRKPDQLSENIEDRRASLATREAIRRRTAQREAPARKSGRGVIVSSARRSKGWDDSAFDKAVRESRGE